LDDFPKTSNAGATDSGRLINSDIRLQPNRDHILRVHSAKELVRATCSTEPVVTRA